ncbi:hypothetical protein BBSC_2024 [Bifidobacterium scardovii JCM 12489 = DSM 13734]|nr:hypothetical protein BBSC_2024 [Bifidobacterium scardovii JCM 12489 = DSM 13734]
MFRRGLAGEPRQLVERLGRWRPGRAGARLRGLIRVPAARISVSRVESHAPRFLHVTDNDTWRRLPWGWPAAPAGRAPARHAEADPSRKSHNCHFGSIPPLTTISRQNTAWRY